MTKCGLVTTVTGESGGESSDKNPELLARLLMTVSCLPHQPQGCTIRLSRGVQSSGIRPVLEELQPLSVQ